MVFKIVLSVADPLSQKFLVSAADGNGAIRSSVAAQNIVAAGEFSSQGQSTARCSK